MFNVLKSALKIIPKQKVYYRKFIKRAPNSLGDYVNTYGKKQEANGSIQPAGANLLYRLGIANTEDLYVVYIHADTVGVNRLDSNDQILDNKGNVYNIIRADVWYDYPIQDWNKLLVRRVKDYD